MINPKAGRSRFPKIWDQSVVIKVNQHVLEDDEVLHSDCGVSVQVLHCKFLYHVHD